MRRAAPSVAALGVLALNVYVFGFALYAATGEGTELTGVLGVVELALAGAAATVAVAAVLSAGRGPFPERSWLLMLLAIALDLVWYAFVFTITENA